MTGIDPVVSGVPTKVSRSTVCGSCSISTERVRVTPPAMVTKSYPAWQFGGIVAPRRTTPLLRAVLKVGDITESLLGVVTYTLFVVS